MLASTTTAPVVLTARALLLDGTIVNSDAVIERCWRGWAVSHGLDPQQALKVVYGRLGHATMVVPLLDRPMEVNHVEMLARETAHTDGVVPVARAPAFLAALDGLPHALVTSADTARATAASVGASKPDPEGFLKGTAALGMDSADCIVFEDSAAGIAAGRGGGHAGHRHGPRAAAHAPTAHVPDLTGLIVAAAADGSILVTLHPRD
ncbi:HAD-IA family hydrolase [Streptomyces sp. NPDC001552]|uniref:HAD-IA family hydrolase n=1 Tax=Streptomyces sp. NPDC001552 TaxID=3364587 RepID=UPI0036BD36FA